MTVLTKFLPWPNMAFYLGEKRSVLGLGEDRTNLKWADSAQECKHA
jgi:hypothetical protein